MGAIVPFGDGSALCPMNLVDIISSDFLTAFELQLLCEVLSVEETSVVFEEGCEVIRYKTHLNSSLYIIIALPPSIHMTLPPPLLVHMFTIVISSCGSGTLHSW